MPMFPQPIYRYTAQSANYTALNGDVVLVTTGASAITVTLPTAAPDAVVIVRKVDSGTGAVTVKTADGSTIDGIAGSTGIATAAAAHVGFTLGCDGVAWHVVTA